MHTPSATLGIAGAGVLLLAGMLIGVWKYLAMLNSPEHRAPLYVDIAHRAAFLYAAACLVLAALAARSAFDERINLAAMLVELFFFAVTIVVYLQHAARGSRTTQFATRTFITTTGMVGLIVGEIGGTAVLLAGFLYGVLR